MLYESHITVSVKDAEAAQGVADRQKWKTSQIARDITLGDDTFFYLTTHATNEQLMFSRLRDCVDELRLANIHVIRQKIEHIIFDTKQYPYG